MAQPVLHEIAHPKVWLPGYTFVSDECLPAIKRPLTFLALEHGSAGGKRFCGEREGCSPLDFRFSFGYHRLESMRKIIYVNTDDFYASVLRVKDPLLRSRPVVVGHLSPRGLVVGASYEAREEGVRPGMTTAQARRLCPRAELVEVDWKLFREASRRLFDVVRRYSPVVEPAGLDEGFVDYTGCRGIFGEAAQAAARIQREVAEASSLQVSLGVAGNKLVSQVASRVAKRGGVVEVEPGGEARFLAQFPLEWLPSLPPRLREELVAMGVRRIGTLAEVPEAIAARAFGPWGRVLVEKARGVDNRPVLPRGERLEAEVTFPEDILSRPLLEAYLYSLAESLGERLRARGRGLRGVELAITYADGYVARSREPTGAVTDQDGDIYRAAAAAWRRIFARRVKVRSLCLAAFGVLMYSEQVEMFHPWRNKMAALYRARDQIRRKYGRVVSTGRTLALEHTPVVAER